MCCCCDRRAGPVRRRRFAERGDDSDIKESNPEKADQSADDATPIGPKWWPSKWGAEDQRGAANLMTPPARWPLPA